MLYWKDYGFCGFSIVLWIFLYFPGFEHFHSLYYCRLLNVNQPSAVFPRLEINSNQDTERCEFSPFVLIDSKLQSLLVTTPTSLATACPTNTLIVQPHMDVQDVPSTRVDIPTEIAAGSTVRWTDGWMDEAGPVLGFFWNCKCRLYKLSPAIPLVSYHF